MMLGSVVITKVSISRQGERKHFQIRLSKDSKHIMGVEYGVRLISNVDSLRIKTITAFLPQPTSPLGTGIASDGSLSQIFKRDILLGEFKLQSCEEANWFYSTNVYANDNNLGFGDFSSTGFPINDFSHGSMRFEDELKVDAKSTIIQAWYKDSLGESLQQNTNYEVSIYLWIKTEEEK